MSEHVANPPKIKAKPMQWLGWQFESQTEAYAGMFLHKLGIPFMYEAEAYEVDGVSTRPDFWLPDQGAWLEIKGRDNFNDEQVRRLSAEHAETVFVATAPLWASQSHARRGRSIIRYDRGERVDDLYEFCRCARCLQWTLQYRGYQSRHDCGRLKTYTRIAGDQYERQTADIIRRVGAEIERFKAWRIIGR